MFDIISKDEYFTWLEAGLADKSNHTLKGIQDAWIISIMEERSQGSSGCKIAEIGGGDSRILLRLKNYNECWNIDKFEGLGQGPKKDPQMPGVRSMYSYMGDFDESVPSNYFDVVFSISVVEHVLNEKVEPFFADCCRILKPGGMMAHAIDVYIFDVPGNLERLDLYRSAVETAGLEWVK
ncbi:class I SAM-dependent methyltransferase [bacterium]|nr:class I SAM-dependent methyltransferase [bacterium]MBU1616032.1 class I SAM-dependent methyltransferase [bacterium]